MIDRITNTEDSTNALPLAKPVLSDAVFRPMLFSTPMVQALLNGTKTQTRRLVNGTIPIGNFDETLKKSVLKIGSIIWVRETFNTNYNDTGFIYKADYKEPTKNKQFWKPSLFMPKTACRIFLEVTNIRIERLNEISESDAIAEGILDMFYGKDIAGNAYFDYMDKKGGWDCVANDAIHSYQTLWQKINGINSWSENPFVWVYSFKVVECPYGFR
jgi:hypothetical protein